MKEIGLDDRRKSCLSRLFSEYHIVCAYLFGSAVKGQTTMFSDVDIALVVAQGSLSSTERLKYELEISEKIDRLCGINRADVRVINEAPIMVRGEVITTGMLIYCMDEVARVEFETRTYSEYFDFLPIAVEIRETHLERVSKRGLHG